MADQAAVDRVMAGEKNLFQEDLSGANFAGMDLKRRVFSHCDLSGADLTGADMRWCDLTSCDLKGAKLDGADMHGCRLSSARIDSPTKTATDLLAAIQAVIAGAKGHKSHLDPSVTLYEIPGCTIVQGEPGTSTYTLVFDAEGAKETDGQVEENPLPSQPWKWPIRSKLYDRKIELVEPIADIQLGED